MTEFASSVFGQVVGEVVAYPWLDIETEQVTAYITDADGAYITDADGAYITD